MDTISGSYNPLLVGLSAAISAFGSFTALQLARQIRHARPQSRERWFWVAGASVAMGAGAIWSMHFIGMTAFELPIPVRYDALITLLSLVIAVGATAGAFMWFNESSTRAIGPLGPGVLMGLGIAGMHYTGMAAMRMPASISYDVWFVGASVTIAIGASIVVLLLIRQSLSGVRWFSCALLMGAGVCAMHYVAMLAATFIRGTEGTAPRTPAISPSVLAYIVFLLAVVLLFAQLGLAVGSRMMTEPTPGSA